MAAAAMVNSAVKVTVTGKVFTGDFRGRGEERL
jgi:hypothetical protein